LYSQHLDLIYYQLGTLYDIIPNSLHSSTDPHQPHPRPHANGVVGSISHAFVNQIANHMGHLSIQSHPLAVVSNAQTIIVPLQTSEVNLV